MFIQLIADSLLYVKLNRFRLLISRSYPI